MTTHKVPLVYRDGILASLLIDLFMCKKEQQPHAENITSIEQRLPGMATSNSKDNQKRSNLRKTI